MKEKIELTRLQRLRNTDPIIYDHIIDAIKQEIEKVDLSRFAPASTVEATRKAILKILEG